MSSIQNGFNSSEVFWSQHYGDGEGQPEAQVRISKFQLFLRNYQIGGLQDKMTGYRKQLHMNYTQGKYFVKIDFKHLANYDKALAEDLRKNPTPVLENFEQATKKYLEEIEKKECHPIQVQIVNFHYKLNPKSSRDANSLRDLKAEHVSQLVNIPGIIINAQRSRPRAIKMRIQCTACKNLSWVINKNGFGSTQLPRRCENAANEFNAAKCPLDPYMCVPDQCVYVDTQKLKMQETPEDVPTGEMPRHLLLYTDREHVDKIQVGRRVNLIGIYSIFSQKQKGKNGKSNGSIRQPYLYVLGIEYLNPAESIATFEPEEEEALRKISRDPNCYEKIWKSIAPNIWGRDDVKKAVACLLFSGSRKFLSGGMKLRGDINVLLLGDPSVAKSQFLKFVHQVAPIGKYTSGKGSSAAGLTAAVMRDSMSGEFTLEAGAMVLADGGVVCIDEFDKMREADRIAIHEAMEQQTISIAKAGITTTLNSRCSVLAAANPIYGRYDDMRTVNENIDFQATILSRFDLIFIIKDVKDREQDQKLADHIMDFHLNVDSSKSSLEAPISADTLTKYVAFARRTCQPRLSRSAAQALKNEYVSFRQTAKKREDETGKQSAIPITVRQLEAIIRIAESLAKMELKEQADENHVKEAVRLFRFATMRAVNQGSLLGSSALGKKNSEFMKNVQRVEEAIQTRHGIGSTSMVARAIKALVDRGHTDQAVAQAFHFMFLRGEIEYFNGNRMFRRKK